MHMPVWAVVLVPCLAGLLWLRRAFTRWRASDPSWKATGVRRAFDGHDESKAPEAAKRAELEANARRRLAVKRTQPKTKPKPAAVVPLRKVAK